MNTLKKTIFSLSASVVFALSAYASVDAVKSGKWSDASTWKDGVLPTASDTIFINPNVEVTVDTTATVKNMTYSSSNDSKYLIITEGGKLTFTDLSNWWYNNRQQVLVEKGGSFDAGTIAWGSGGWNNITVTGKGSSFTSKFKEMRGSTVNGGSKLLVTDKATATAGGEWKLNANNGGTMIVEATNGGTINSQALYADAAANSKSIIRVLDGGKIVSSGLVGLNYWDAYIANASNQMIIAGSGSNLSTTNGNNNIYVGNKYQTSKVDATASLQFGYVDENGVFTAADKNALYSNYEFKVFGSGELKFLVGAENAIEYGTKVGYSDVILNAKYFKEILGDFVVDLTQVDGLEAGQYSVALFGSSSGETISFDNYDSILKIVESDTVKALKGEDGKAYTIDGSIFYLNFEVIPEPSTYAMIFGALALAFAAYRRRK